MDNPNVFTNDPALKAALDALNTRWPWTLSWSDLQDAVRGWFESSGVDAGEDLQSRIDGLLEVLILGGQANYRLAPISPPSVSALQIEDPSRRMVEVTRVDDTEAVTFNRWHQMYPLSSIDPHLLPLLDGTRDDDALLETLLGIARREQIHFAGDDTRLTGDAETREALAAQIHTMSTRLTAMKLCR